MRAGVADGTLAGLWGEGGMFALVTGSGITAARPEGAADAYAVVHDRTLAVGETGNAPFGLLHNDPDGCDCFTTNRTVELVEGSGPAHGRFVDANGDPVSGLDPSGAFRYKPDPGYVGEDGFEYRIVTDCGESDPIPVAISVTNSNAVALSTLLGEVNPFGVNALPLPALDADGDPLQVEVTVPPAGTLYWADSSGFGYQRPAASVSDSYFTDGLAFRVNDGFGWSDEATVVIQGPVLTDTIIRAYPNAASVLHDRSVTDEAPVRVTVNSGKLGGGEEGGGFVDPVTAVIVSGPAHGTASISNRAFTYTPDKGFVGPDSFQFVGQYQDQTSNVSKVYLTAYDQTPVAHADAFQTVQGDELFGSVVANDVDADQPAGDEDWRRFRVTPGLVTVEHGELVLDPGGTFTYTPEPGFYGHDKFTYKLTDGAMVTGDTTVWISVLPNLLGDKVWQDTNANGQQDAGEPGVPDATVKLYDPSGMLLGTTTTDLHGGYGFRGVTDGSQYELQFVRPPKYKDGTHFTLLRVGNAESDNDAMADGKTGVFTMPASGVDCTRDAGLTCGCTPGPDHAPVGTVAAGWEHWNTPAEWVTLPNGDRRTPVGDRLPPDGKSRTNEGPYMQTVKEWGAFSMRVEYRTLDAKPVPPAPLPSGTPRAPLNEHYGNSGVYIYNRYEVQIVEPPQFDLPNGVKGVAVGGVIMDDRRDGNNVPVAAPDGTIKSNRNQLLPGGLYTTDPLLTHIDPQTGQVGYIQGEFINWSNGVGIWNTLEIDFKPPVLSGCVILKAAMVTTRLNGHVIHDGPIIRGNASASGTGNSKSDPNVWPPQSCGPIFLQSHWGSQVEFRNPIITATG